ncbi:class I SAM-dependent methyltransferase [Peribacillus sp. NPDC097675]|uniref:class I SAM-dependent methyltransferase n=1 Tax=Peribacillus sp. NPDC097675 TaxID=3390618 RepID=UPI003D04529E
MEEKDQVLAQFGKNAANYVTSKTHASGEDLNLLIKIVEKNAKGELLDIATGGGHVVKALAPFFEKVTALDLTPEMLKKAENFINSNGIENVSFVQGDAEQLPFSDQSFTTVTCRIAPHHFPNIHQFVMESNRVLDRNGLFLLIDNVAAEKDEYDQFYNFIEKKRDPSHYRAYKKTEWISLIENTGFTIESMTTFKKKFDFKNWCEMMQLPQKEQNELMAYMIAAEKGTSDFHSIEVVENQVLSFQGQAMLLVARKE